MNGHGNPKADKCGSSVYKMRIIKKRFVRHVTFESLKFWELPLDEIII